MISDEEAYRVTATVPVSQITEDASMLESKSVGENARAYRMAHIKCRVDTVDTEKHMFVDVDKLQLVDDSDRWTCALPRQPTTAAGAVE